MIKYSIKEKIPEIQIEKSIQEIHKKKKQTIQSPLLHNKKEIADYAISFSMTRTGFEPVLPP